MRLLQHRRHSRRDPGGVHLNEAGLALARRVAPGLPRFDRVVTSPLPRARETAEAMGLPVDAEVPELIGMPDPIGDLIWAARGLGFDGLVRLARADPAVRQYTASQAEVWKRELGQVPEGGSLLMVSHGGIIEAGAVGAVPARVAEWGRPIEYLEGVELRLDHGRWIGGTVLREPPEPAGRPGELNRGAVPVDP